MANDDPAVDDGRDQSQRTKRRFDLDGVIDLADILRSFHSPLSEEQIWSLCHQACRLFQDVSDKEPNRTRYLVDQPQWLVINRDGSVSETTVFGEDDSQDGEANQQRTVASSESALLSSLAVCLYAALDFGLDDTEERQLSNELESLLLKLTATDDGLDEGIQMDTELTSGCVVQMCRDRIAVDNPDSHYKNVCRALVHEAIELAAFLAQVTTGVKAKTSAGTSGGGGGVGFDEEDADQLQFAVSEWAKLWIQVVKELRSRTRTLRKVENPPQVAHRREFALTPFEMLLEDIRTKKYKLNKAKLGVDDDGVDVDGRVASRKRVKKDAHAMILDFIRSRPPLMPYKQRQVKFLERRESLSLYDKLLNDIRTGDHQKRLKHIDCKSEGATPVKRFVQKEPEEMAQTARRLIKADLDLLSDDEDFLAITSLPIEINMDTTRPASSSPPPSSSDDEFKKEDRRRFSLRNLSLKFRLSREKSTTETPKTKSSSPTTLEDESPINCQEDTRQRLELIWSEEDKWQNKPTLSLTLQEICAIRKALTKAEIESLSVTKAIRGELQSGKICFNCLKTKFSILSLNRPFKCRLCERAICARCVTSMCIPNKTFQNIPIYCLSPSPLSPVSINSTTFAWVEAAVKSKVDDENKNNNKKGDRVKVCRDCKLLVRHLINCGWQ